jgi:diguanylate cyclase (GGDEF)-like protein
MALQEVARRLQATTRQEETLARLGGDEFVLVAEGADHETAAMIALRILRLLIEPIRPPATCCRSAAASASRSTPTTARAPTS